MGSGAGRGAFGFAGLLVLAAGAAAAEEPARDIEALRRQVEGLKAEIGELRRTDAEKIEDLKRKIAAIEAGRPLDAEPPPAGGDAGKAEKKALASWRNFRLVDASVDVMAVAGTCSDQDQYVETIFGGAADPKRRGFTFQQAEVALAGSIDPYLRGEVYVTAGEDGVELGEAFLATESLPCGLEVKAGYFLTEFGLTNPTHPHAWAWIDQPAASTRFMGPKGLRAPGLRLSWLAPASWHTQLYAGMQAAGVGETVSFLGNGDWRPYAPGSRSEEVAKSLPFRTGLGRRPIVERNVEHMGDFVYLLRWDNRWDLSDVLSARLGLSGLAGPNNTGSDGFTLIYGLDWTMKWRLGAKKDDEWPFVVLETEFMKRDFRADDYNRYGIEVRGGWMRDWGIRGQVLWGFSRNWAAGLRWDYATFGGQSAYFSIDGAGAVRVSYIRGDHDPMRNFRYRLSPLLAYHISKYARVRLQCNLEQADHLTGEDAYSVWLCIEGLFGSHPRHRY